MGGEIINSVYFFTHKPNRTPQKFRKTVSFLLLSSQISVTLVLDIYRIRLRYLSVVN